MNKPIALVGLGDYLLLLLLLLLLTLPLSFVTLSLLTSFC